MLRRRLHNSPVKKWTILAGVFVLVLGAAYVLGHVKSRVRWAVAAPGADENDKKNVDGGAGTPEPEPEPEPVPVLVKPTSESTPMSTPVSHAVRYLWNTCRSPKDAEGDPESILASSGAVGPYQPEFNANFEAWEFPGLKFDQCVSYNCHTLSPVEYDAHQDGVMCRWLSYTEYRSKVESLKSTRKGGIVTATSVADGLFSPSRIVVPKRGYERIINMVDTGPAPARNVSLLVSCISHHYSAFLYYDDTISEPQIDCLKMDHMMTSLAIMENVLIGRLYGGELSIHFFAGAGFVPESTVPTPILIGGSEGSINLEPPVQFWRAPSVMNGDDVYGRMWLDVRAQVQRMSFDAEAVFDGTVTPEPRLCKRVVDRLIMIEEPALVIPGDGIWHSQHNIWLRIFASIREAGWMKCDDRDVCTIDKDHRFEVALMPGLIPLAIYANSGGLLGVISWEDARGICAREAILGSPSDLDSLFTVGNNLGSILRQFSIFLATYTDRNSTAFLAVPTLLNLPPRPAVRLLHLLRPGWQRGFFGPVVTEQFPVWCKERGVDYKPFFATRANLGELIEEMQKATIIFGATGAAMTNLWHTRPGTVIVMVMGMTNGLWGETYYFRNMALSRDSCFVRWDIDLPSPLIEKGLHFTGCPTRLDGPYMDPQTVNREAFLEVLNVALKLGVNSSIYKANGTVAESTGKPEHKRCRAHMIVDCPLTED